MSSSVAPLFPTTSVFIPAYWATARAETLTQEEADARYLRFPTGQGTESIPNLIVSGTSTLGITSTNALTATQFTATTGSYGTAQKFYADTSDTSPLQLTTTAPAYTEKYFRLYSGSSLTNSTMFIQAEQNDYYAQLQLLSGTTTTAPKVVLQAYIDYTASPSPPSSTINKITLGDNNGDDIYITNGNPDNDLTENNITLHDDGSYTNNYVKLRSAFAFAGIESFLTLGINNFTLSINNQTAITIADGSTDPVVYRRNISLTTFTSGGTPCGVLEKTLVNTTTTGTTTMTLANAFQTTLNTPTAINRIFVLPVPTAASVGYWYGICNRATGFTIIIQYPAATTIFTINAATSATNGGASARFAVNADATTYARIG